MHSQIVKIFSLLRERKRERERQTAYRGVLVVIILFLVKCYDNIVSIILGILKYK